MNGDNERDYAEEAAVQRDIEVEGLAELAAERSDGVGKHMSGADHYREAERILAGEVVAAGDPGRVMVLDGEALFAAQVHATLAVAAATAMNVRRNGAVEAVDEAAAWERVLR